MAFRIEAITSNSLSDAQWQEYYDLLLKLREQHKSSCRSASWSNLKQRVTSHLAEDEHFHPALVLEGDRMVGWIDFTARNVSTLNQVAWPAYDVLPSKIPETMIRAMAEWILVHLRNYDAASMYHMAWDPRFCAIDELWQGEQFSRSQEFVMHRSSADQETISRWVTEIPRHNPNLSLVLRDEIPDGLLDAYVRLLQEGMTDIPEEGDSGLPNHVDAEEIRRVQEWCQANGVLCLHGCLHDNNGTLVALTEASANLQRPEAVDQLMTTVTRSYRGRGLAKWLKGAMFLELERRLPEFERVVTWMRSINEPIQHINSRMGFEPEREAREFKISRTSLENYLDTSS